MLLAVAACLALDNGLGFLPGLGWNSDYCANCSHPSAENGFGGEHFVAAIAKYMHEVKQPGAGATLQELGFHYINMDASWDLPERSTDGKLQPDPKLWPSGLEATVQHVHALGFGFGLYGDRGDKDCAKNPGNRGHEVADAQQYAAWGIDWYKTDSCNASGDPATAIAQYSRMRDALNATGRPIWLALCGWKPFYAPPDPTIGYAGGKSLGNSWRTGDDTGGGWTHVVSNIVNALGVARWAGPTAHGGGWNDGSLQLTPGMGGGPPPPLDGGPLPSSSDHMDVPRFVSMYSAWCVLALNLLLTGNFSGLSPVVLATWSNPEVLSINQDPSGLPAFQLNATRLHRSPDPRAASQGYVQAVMAECGGEPERQQWSYNATGLGEVRNVFRGAVCLNVRGCETSVIYDGCSPAQPFGCGSNEAFAYDDGAHRLVSRLPGRYREGTGKAHRLVSRLPGAKCLTEDGETHLLSIAPCAATDSAAAALQYFEFTSGGELVDKAGLCLTAAGSSPPPQDDHFFIGRRLGGGARAQYGASPAGYAVILLANGDTDLTATCAAACLAQLGIAPSDGADYTVRDVWGHATVGTVNAKGGRWLTMRAKAGGGSQVVRLSKKQVKVLQ